MRTSINKIEAFQIIKDHLVTHCELDPEEIVSSANLFTDLGLDSIDALDLIAVMEKKLKIKVHGEELKKMRTVGDVTTYVVSHVS